jgi:hypothetical protein
LTATFSTAFPVTKTFSSLLRADLEDMSYTFCCPYSKI